MALFDIIIATYNNLGELKSCLAGFERQTIKDFRLLICVDGSTDGTLEFLKNQNSSMIVKVLVHPKSGHRGRNATRNLALHHIQSSFLCTFDSDIVPSPRFLEKHCEFLNREKCISVGAIHYTNRNINFWADYIQTRGMYKYRHKSLIPPYYLTTGNMAMPSYYFKAINGQDENMVQYGGGDTELAYRLHQRFRLPVRFNAEAIGYSEMNKQWRTGLKQMETFGRYSLPYIYRKHPEFTELFRFDRLISGSFQNRLLRLFLQFSIAKWAMSVVPHVPRLIRRRVIHFLVFYHIYRGYQDSLRNHS